MTKMQIFVSFFESEGSDLRKSLKHEYYLQRSASVQQRTDRPKYGPLNTYRVPVKVNDLTVLVV